MGHVNVIWQGDANAQVLRCLRPLHDADDADQLHRPGDALGALARARARPRGSASTPQVIGQEAPTALLSDTTRATALFGYPRVPLGRDARLGRRLGRGRAAELRQADQVRGPRWRASEALALDAPQRSPTSPAAWRCRRGGLEPDRRRLGVLHRSTAMRSASRRASGTAGRDRRGARLRRRPRLDLDGAGRAPTGAIAASRRCSSSAASAAARGAASRRCSTRRRPASRSTAHSAFAPASSSSAGKRVGAPAAARRRGGRAPTCARAERCRSRRASPRSTGCRRRRPPRAAARLLAPAAARGLARARRQRLRDARAPAAARRRSARSSPHEPAPRVALLARALARAVGAGLHRRAGALARRSRAAPRRRAASSASARSCAWRSATRAPLACGDRMFALAGPEFG